MVNDITFEHIINDNENSRYVLSYIMKNRRNGISYIVYRNSDNITISEDMSLENAIGIIDRGIFLPIL